MRKYTDEALKEAVKSSTTWRGVMRMIGLRPGGGSHTSLRSYVVRLGLDTSRFKVERKVFTNKRKLAEEILVERSPLEYRTETYQLRRALLEADAVYVCSMCGLGDMWQERPLVLQIDHIDGNAYNHRKENLRFLCPNCHSQTETYGFKRRSKREEERNVLAAAMEAGGWYDG
ncbi:MAG: HNH endonuclease signature motif containing protein [Candidatus Thorarchaeota archaeon]|jgi:hypothetical protein